MSWSIGFDSAWGRDIGYGVPAFCDHPGCNAEINRGLSFVCGGEPYGGEYGCGLYFCRQHLGLAGARREHKQLCANCFRGRVPFTPAEEHPTWLRWKLRDTSWGDWRKKNPEAVQGIREALRCAAKEEGK